MGPVITKHKPIVPKKVEVAKRSPFNVEVTGGWYLNAKNGNSSTWTLILLCSCFFGVGYLLAKLNGATLRDRQDTSLLFEIRALGQKVRHLEQSIKILKSHCVPDTNSQLPEDNNVLLFRRKRSSIEPINERKERKRNRRNRTKIIKTVAAQFSAHDPFGLAKRPLEGVLGPWMESFTKDTRNTDLFGAVLKENGRKLEISRKGLYFVYAQVTYRTINVPNSFSINVIFASNKQNGFISTCSVHGNIMRDGEQSCYTAAVYHFDLGDLVYIQQGQPNREINFDDSLTFFGLIFLG